MKAHRLIADALLDWRAVRDAADLAHDIVGRLDDDEHERLVLRALTDEVRAQLRRKDPNGVPVYGNVEHVDEGTGERVRQYKQTSLFDYSDYQVAAQSCLNRIAAENRTLQALREDCNRRLHRQLTLDGEAA